MAKAKVASRRNSGATPPINTVAQQPGMASAPEETTHVRTSLTSTSRSRLAQELLEQNSAILQKMKTDRSFDQPSLGVSTAPTVSGSSSVRNASPPSPEEEVHTPSAFNPFPVRRESLRRPPKDVAVKMGLYETSLQLPSGRRRLSVPAPSVPPRPSTAAVNQ